MFLFIIILGVVMLVGSLIYYVIANHMTIDFKSFIKKGFIKNDNDFGLYCYTGKQGKGKTYTSINFLINYIVNNPDTQIVTNIHSFKTFKNIVYIDDIDKLIDYCIENYENQKIIIFFDEIFTILEKKTAINKKILSFISQLRKRKIIFITTAQEWAEVNITFRRYVRFQIDCNMFNIPIINRAFLFYSINDGDGIKWDEQQQEFVAPRVSCYFGKAKQSVINEYDTFETISTNK